MHQNTIGLLTFHKGITSLWIVIIQREKPSRANTHKTQRLKVAGHFRSLHQKADPSEEDRHIN